MTDALTLQEIEVRQADGTLQDAILPVDALLKQYPAYEITEQAENYLRNGNKLSPRFSKIWEKDGIRESGCIMQASL